LDTAWQGLARSIVRALEDKKAQDVLVLDLRGVATYADCLVLCSGTSSPHVQALVRNVEERASERPVYVNASPDHSWWVLDYIDVVLHVFRSDIRPVYGVEDLWSDARTLGPGEI
jgi:ribosome-associated protein